MRSKSGGFFVRLNQQLPNAVMWPLVSNSASKVQTDQIEKEQDNHTCMFYISTYSIILLDLILTIFRSWRWKNPLQVRGGVVLRRMEALAFRRRSGWAFRVADGAVGSALLPRAVAPFREPAAKAIILAKRILHQAKNH